MSTIVMNPPHRKPLPQRYDAVPSVSSYAAMPPQPPLAPRQAMPSTQAYPGNGQEAGMMYNRAPSNPIAPTYSMTSQHQYQPTPPPPSSTNNTTTPYNPANSRRTLSNATTSTTSSSHHAPTASLTSNLQRVSTSSSTTSGVRRSTSSRSNTSSISPTSYVALMRKQKATVWCDRAQHEDPRFLAAQRQAKARAAAEVAGSHANLASVYGGYGGSAGGGGSGSGHGVVGGVRSKIRHHGAPKASVYSGMVVGGGAGGVGVPIRMSASEVDEDGGSDAEDAVGRYHSRKGSSGRSSVGSAGRGNGRLQSLGYGSGSPGESLMGDLREEEPTPMPRTNSGPDYFGQTGGSGNSAERGEEAFGTVGGLPTATGGQTAQARVEEKKYSADELRRRGSVDDRTMTMGGGRLFVANPDLSD